MWFHFNKIKFLIPAVILTIFISSGCNESVVTPPSDNIEISYMSDRSAMQRPSTGDTVVLGGDVLILTSAKVLVKDIKLNVASGSDSVNFKTGPFVINLDLSAGVGTSVNLMTTAQVPEGTYDKVKFEIHKLENNETPPDPEFVDANGRYSVIAKGTYNGNPFTYKSSKSAHQKLDLNNSLVISNSGKTNITLTVKPYTWFIINNLVILDPNDSSNQNEIDNNIKASFKAFRDKDKDGVPD